MHFLLLPTDNLSHFKIFRKKQKQKTSKYINGKRMFSAWRDALCTHSMYSLNNFLAWLESQWAFCHWLQWGPTFAHCAHCGSLHVFIHTFTYALCDHNSENDTQLGEPTIEWMASCALKKKSKNSGPSRTKEIKINGVARLFRGHFLSWGNYGRKTLLTLYYKIIQYLKLHLLSEGFFSLLFILFSYFSFSLHLFCYNIPFSPILFTQLQLNTHGKINYRGKTWQFN